LGDDDSTNQQRGGLVILRSTLVLAFVGLTVLMGSIRTTTFCLCPLTTKIQADLCTMVRVAEASSIETGSVPRSIEDLTKGPTAPLDNVKDPWGNDYIYFLHEGRPVAGCLGKDGQFGGEGDDADWFFPSDSTPRPRRKIEDWVAATLGRLPDEASILILLSIPAVVLWATRGRLRRWLGRP
jgi:hypothetical protein